MMKIFPSIKHLKLLVAICVLVMMLPSNIETASADSVSTGTSCTSTNNVTTGVRYTISVSYGDGWTASKWYYSYDGSEGSYVELDGISGNSMNFTLDSWYSSSFGPYVKGVSSSNVSKVFNNSSTSCNGITIRSYKPTLLNAAAPTGNAGSGQTLTSAVTFTTQAIGISKSYKWQRCTDSAGLSCADIAGATFATYVAGASDAGKYLRTVVIGSSTVNSVTQSTTGTSALTAQISESVPGTPGTPTAVAGDGEVTVTVVAPSTGGSPSSYTVTALDSSGTALSPAKNCTVTGTSGSCVISSLTNGTAYKFSAIATNGAGSSSSSTASTSATPIAIPPTVTAVNSSTGNASYKVGDTVSIQVTFSESVVVTGTPQLTLETGSTDRVLNYASGSGTNSLTFNYTVQAGDTSADLDYASTSALALNGGSINDAAGNTGVLTLPGLGASGSLGANKAIVIDTSLPTITSFSSTTSDGAYKAGSTINITAIISEPVTASASITVTLDNGKTVVLTHSAVNNTLTGTYTVAAGDTSADLTVSSYALTSAPTDAAGNIMVDLTVPSGSNNIAGAKAITVDTTAPSTPSTPDLDSTSDSAGASDSDNITSDNTPKINVSGSFSGTAVVTATKAGSANVTCTISSNTCTLGTLADGVWSISVTDTDAAGNASTSAGLSITVDATAPTPTVATVSVTTASGVNVRSSEAGTAYLVKSTVSVSGLSSITGAANDAMNQVSISAGATDTNMSTAGLVAGDYKLYVVDAAGNLSLASTNTVTVAVAAAPTASASTAPTGTTTFGSTFTNAVTFNGVPTPTLSFQWKSCTNATDTSTACSDISGATGSSFIANAIELVGKFIRVLVTAINGVSPDATAWSSPTAAITPVAPGVPVVGTPTLGDLQINVPVTAPASNGGSTILKYQFSTDGGATWMDRTDTATVSSPIVIKFLSTDGTTPIVAGTTYPVQIRAVNSASSPNGAGSASVSVTAATAPGAPTSVTATATGQSTATITFTAPTSNGNSPITSYTVSSSPGGVTVSGSSSPISVTGLNASTAYTFTVTASNAAGTSIASGASSSITTTAPPAPAPEPVCNAACVAAAEAKVVSDTAAKAAVEKVSVDMTAAEAAAKAAVDKAAAAVVAKAAADAAAAQAALVAKAAEDAQAAAVEAASKAAAALKSATTTAAGKATATATAAKAATTAAKAVQAAAAAAKVAAAAKNVASNASKRVDIAIGALGSKTAAATSAAQANAIAAAAKAAANAAAKSAVDAAAAAKVASNNANREATAAAARIASEQKEAADAAAAAKAAADADLKANELKIATAIESQKATEAVVAALNEKVALAEASVKAATVAERVEIDKKLADVSTKIAELQKVADEVQVKADDAIATQLGTRAAAEIAIQNAVVQANEVVAAKLESIAKSSAATKAAADASLAAKIATAAKAAAAKVPAKAKIASKPSTSKRKNSTKATITGLKPGQKVKVTVNVKGK